MHIKAARSVGVRKGEENEQLAEKQQPSATEEKNRQAHENASPVMIENRPHPFLVQFAWLKRKKKGAVRCRLIPPPSLEHLNMLYDGGHTRAGNKTMGPSDPVTGLAGSRPLASRRVHAWRRA